MNNPDRSKYIHIDEVYKLVAGHSIYGGDSILCAFKCLTEGKEVKPIEPLDITYYEVSRLQKQRENKQCQIGKWINNNCSICGYGVRPWNNTPYCPNCGAKMEVARNEQM